MSTTSVGLASERPSRPSRGKRFVASDTNQEWVGDGSEWVELTGGAASTPVLQIVSEDSGAPYAVTRMQVLLYPEDNPVVTWDFEPEEGGILDGGDAIEFNPATQEVTFLEDGVYRATWSLGVSIDHPTAASAEVYALVSTDTNKRFGMAQPQSVALNGPGGLGKADVSGSGIAIVNAGEKLRFIAGTSQVDAGDNDLTVMLTLGGTPGTRLWIERIADAPVPA